MVDFSQGSWAHKPKKPSFFENHGREWITAIFALVLIAALASVAGKAISNAAYDSVNFDQFQQLNR